LTISARFLRFLIVREKHKKFPQAFIFKACGVYARQDSNL